MRRYQVVLKRNSYLTVEVNAESEDLAYDDVLQSEREFYNVSAVNEIAE